MSEWTMDDIKAKGFHINTETGIGKKIIGAPEKKVRAKKVESKFAPYKGSEDEFQIAVANFLDSKKLIWTHVANERRTDIKTNSKGIEYSGSGAKIKARGLKRGVPDCLIFEPTGTYSGMAIELKCGKNKTSKQQDDWMFNLRLRNWQTLVSYSLDEVMSEVEKYLKS